MLDPLVRFSATVDRYARYRPSYPAEIVDWTLRLAPTRRVVDLGAGTGISARQWASRGVSVVGIEPNDAMRAAAQSGGRATFAKGTAEATGLASGSADLVIGCQAFHWFDLDRTLPEIDRLLRPGGHAVAVWNERARTPLLEAYRRLLEEHVHRDERDPSFPATLAALRARHPGAKEIRVPSEQYLDRAGLRGRAWSASYVAHGVADADAFDRALDALFDRFEEGGELTLDYETVAITWGRQAST